MRSSSVVPMLAVCALLLSERCDSDPSPLEAVPPTSLPVITAPAHVGTLLDAAPIGRPGPLDLLLTLTLGAALIAVQLRRKQREWRDRKLSA